MALSPIEDRYLSALTAAQFPDMPAAEPAMPVEPGAMESNVDGMVLAAGPSQTVSDAGAAFGIYPGAGKRKQRSDIGERMVTGAPDFAAGALRGATTSALGIGGDIQKIGRFITALATDNQGGSLTDKLGRAAQTMSDPTFLPSSTDVSEGGYTIPGTSITLPGLPAAVPAGQGGMGMTPEQRQAAAEAGQVAGELVGDPVMFAKAGQLAVKAGKALPKNLPVGMSTQAIGGMQNVLTPTAKATAPVNDMGFYSAVEQAALNIQRKSGTGQAMLNDITKGQDVKLDEVKWIGLDEFLKGKKNVTREEVQQYIAQNKVDIQEVTLGEQGGQKGREIAAQDMREVMEAGGTFDDDAQYALQRWLESDPNSRTAKSQEALLEEKLSDAGDRRFVSEFVDAGSAQTDETRYGQYTLPGGENYREILLTMPNTKAEKLNARAEELLAMGRAGTATDADRAEWALIMNKLQPETRDIEGASRFRGMPDYKSSHWDQPNVLAHIRVNDRVDADGKKMLLIEEVQSDWHQAGRDKGYASDVGPKVSDAEYKRGVELQQRDVRGEALTDAERQEMQDILRRHDASVPGTKVPDAPMKDTWYQLALKRVLKYAADNGYERVGLTTGKTNAERFDLSKQVDEIAVPMVNSDGTRSVRIDPIEGTSIKLMVDANGVVTGYGPSSNQFSGKKLNEVVGKEMAEKIMAADKETKFTGLDLSVGGEGMKKYYDEVYPQFLAKYGKKWGAKVGETKLKTTDIDPARWTIVRDADNNFRIQDSLSDRFAEPGVYSTREDAVDAIGKMNYREPVRFVDITPEMRQGVGKGQPLFSATAAGAGTGAATMQDKEQK